MILLALSLALAIPHTLILFTFDDMRTPQVWTILVLIQGAFGGADSVRMTGLASYGNSMGMERFVVPHDNSVILQSRRCCLMCS